MYIPSAVTAHPSRGLTGDITVPGDKSISHRSLILGALAVGRTEVTGLLAGEDVLRTAAAVAALGARVERHEGERWTIDGVGVGGLMEPASVLDLGNSGTGVRLLLGIVSTHPINATFTGDASLTRRPMRRVTAPLARFGAAFYGRAGDLLPMTVVGSRAPLCIEYRVPVPSAQVKSAVLLAALNAPGRTTVTEPVATRDHTERMLRHFGATISVEEADGGRRIAIDGETDLRPARIAVPGDISSGAFPLVAALITEGSDLTIRNIGLNPLRTGLLACLREMGAELEIVNPRTVGDEPVGDLRARSSRLEGVTVPADRAASMIDEYPILAMAAAVAHGETRLLGLEELKVKESDRLSAIARGLSAAGVVVEVDGDALAIKGCGGPVPGGALVEAALDHRIAMAFLTLGGCARAPITIDDAATIETSFPSFLPLMTGLGADLRAAG